MSRSDASGVIGYLAPTSVPFAPRSSQPAYHHYPEGLDLSIAGSAKLECAGLTISSFGWQQQSALLEDGRRDRHDPYRNGVFCQLWEHQCQFQSVRNLALV